MLAEPSTCRPWLASASRPPAAATEVSASRSGTSAAMNAPKAMSRIPKVSGIEIDSARAKSLPIVSSMALVADADPNSRTRSCGCRAATPSTARSTGVTRSDAVSALPFIAKRTTAERRSRLTCRASSSGERTSVTRPVACTAATTSRMAARPGGLSTSARSLTWTSTCSAAGRSNPARSSVRLAAADWPSRVSAVVSPRRPALPPITAAISTKMSQPTIALPRCRALQRPARAAIPGVVVDLMVSPLRR